MKFSKSIFAFFCIFSFFAVLAMAQGQTAPDDATPAGNTRTAQDLPAESDMPIVFGNPADQAATGGRTQNTLFVFFRMIFVLIVVVACIYFVLSFVRKKTGGQIQDSDMFLRKVAAISIAPGKSVQIVTLLERAYLLGVTDNSIELLGEITDKELVDAMNLNADRNANVKKARSFEDVLSIFLKPQKGGASKKKPAAGFDEFFKAQSDKINGS